MEELLTWAESWGPLLPITAFLLRRRSFDGSVFVFWYFVSAFALNTSANLIWKQEQLGLDFGTTNNTGIYNVSSFVRFCLLSSFFVKHRETDWPIPKRIVVLIYFVLLSLNYWLLESFVDERIANNAHAVEAGLLLLLCLIYYLQRLKSDENLTTNDGSLWVVTGLSVFVIIAFPIYLLYDRILDGHLRFTINIWKVQKAGFLFFCFASACGFLVSSRQRVLQYE